MSGGGTCRDWWAPHHITAHCAASRPPPPVNTQSLNGQQICQLETLSHCHNVTLSHCHNVTKLNSFSPPRTRFLFTHQLCQLCHNSACHLTCVRQEKDSRGDDEIVVENVISTVMLHHLQNSKNIKSRIV